MNNGYTTPSQVFNLVVLNFLWQEAKVLLEYSPLSPTIFLKLVVCVSVTRNVAGCRRGATRLEYPLLIDLFCLQLLLPF